MIKKYSVKRFILFFINNNLPASSNSIYTKEIRNKTGNHYLMEKRLTIGKLVTMPAHLPLKME